VLTRAEQQQSTGACLRCSCVLRVQPLHLPNPGSARGIRAMQTLAVRGVG